MTLTVNYLQYQLHRSVNYVGVHVCARRVLSSIVHKMHVCPKPRLSICRVLCELSY